MAAYSRDVLTAIFGAGASYDSVNPRLITDVARQLHIRPPLASELFADRQHFSGALDAFTQVRALIPRLRGAANTGGTIEAELGKIQAEAATFPKRLKQLAAVRFYLRTILTDTPTRWSRIANGVTNYHALVDLLDQWSTVSNSPVRFATFNYDTLVEQAMSDEGVLKSRTIDSYIENDRWQLHKLHGSVDWGRVVATNELLVGYAGGLEQGMIEFVDLLPITDEFVKIEGRPTTNIDYWFPALAIPLDAKSSFECPKSHLAAARTALRDCRRLLLIGWAANDRHFLELCGAEQLSPEATLVVAGNESNGQAVAAKLGQIGIGRNVYVYAGGFSELVENGGAAALHQFLQ